MDPFAMNLIRFLIIALVTLPILLLAIPKLTKRNGKYALLAGIYIPTSGSIQVNAPLTPFIELGVGFNPELTGRENVFLNGALLGFSRDEMSEMYDDIVEFAELERFMDQKLKNYSSGMQVRLACSINAPGHQGTRAPGQP
jgi:ABC-type polysaccharide/polyol phosphate transport system ATPase subunit